MNHLLVHLNTYLLVHLNTYLLVHLNTYLLLYTSRGISELKIISNIPRHLFPAFAGNKWVKFKTSQITDKELKLVDPQPLGPC